MSALLKSAGFIGLYFAFGLLAGMVSSGGDSVHVTLLADVCMILAGTLYLSRGTLRTDREFRARRRSSGRAGPFRVLSGCAAFLSIWLLVQITATYLSALVPDVRFGAYQSAFSGADPTEALVLAMLAAPAAEEVLMRGVVQTLLRGRFGPVPAVLVSGCVFAVLHGTVTHLYTGAVLGICFGITYERTRSLPVCVFAHAACNAAAVAVAAAGIVFRMSAAVAVLVVILNVWMAFLLASGVRGTEADHGC